MQTYIEKAVEAYKDLNQTAYARNIAQSVLKEAGFTEEDLASLLDASAPEYNLYLFAA